MNIGNDAVELYVSKVKPLVYQRIFRSVMAYISGSGESYQSITQRVNTIADSKTRFALMAVLAKNASIISEAEANQAINAAPSRQMMHVLRAILAGGGVSTPSYYLNLSSPSNVTIADGQARGTITSTYNAVITASMSPSRTTGVAPLYVNFDATATTSTAITDVDPVTQTARRGHELFYAHDFGDSGAGVWANGVQSAGLTSKNAGYGPVTGHVYETPGTYTVTMSVTDGVNTVTKTGTIVVQDPNTVYAGALTICISHSGNFTGAPSGASQVNTSGNTDMYAAWVAHKASNKRILFCKADMWTCSQQLPIASLTGVTISGYGTGATRAAVFGASASDTLVSVTPSELSGSVFNIDASTSDLCIHNFKITSNSGTKAVGINSTIDGVLVSKVEVRGCSSGFSAYPGGGGTNSVMDQLCLYECLVDELYGYAGAAGNTPRASSTTNGTSTLSATAHPFIVGYGVQFPTTAPSPLAINTTYYISADSLATDSFRLAATLADAKAGANSLGSLVAGTHLLTANGMGGGIGVFAGFVRGGMLGCYIDACNHGEQTVRLPFLDRAHINNNYIARPNQGKNIVKIHGFVYSEVALYSEKIVFSANVMSARDGYSNGSTVAGATMTEVGDIGIICGNGGVSGNERVRNVIFENNITYACLGNPRTMYFAGIGCPNVTLRNNIADFSIDDRSTPYTATDTHISVNFMMVNSSTPDPTVGVRVYNNTLYSNLYNPELACFVRFTGTATSVAIKNNLWYLKCNPATNNLYIDEWYENSGGYAVTPDVSNNTGILGLTAKDDPLFTVTPPVALADWKPATGSYAISGGTSLPVLRDFNNVTRYGADNHLGAVLP